MDLQRETVFSYLEEDNAQSAYFRVLPLLTAGGDIQEEARRNWPDNGALRIIPDRNEQYTFKDRMRGMGSWCVIDLTAFPAEANKIRTNKNYHSDRGEENRYIIFSDAVRPLDGAPYFEVLQGTAGEAARLAADAITPRFYILEGDTLYGPVDRQAPETPGVSEAMEASLLTLPLPDGKTHTLLCPQQAAPEPAPEPEKAPAPEPEAPPEREKPREELPIGENLEILDGSKTYEETLQSLSLPLSGGSNLLKSKARERESQAAAAMDPRKLCGTALNRTGVQTSVPIPKNHVQEVVSSRLQAIRSADPQAAPVPFSCDLNAVENPVEQAMAAVRRAWAIVDTRPRLISLLFSLDGFRCVMDAFAPCAKTDAEERNRCIEEERLRLLVELDQAKADMAAFRAKAIAEASARARRELDSLRREEEVLRMRVEELRAQAGEDPAEPENKA